jgi:hypothetical protein
MSLLKECCFFVWMEKKQGRARRLERGERKKKEVVGERAGL